MSPMRKKLLFTASLVCLAASQSYASMEKHDANENVLVPSSRETYQFYDIGDGAGK